MLHSGGGGCRYILNHKLWWSEGEESLNGVGVVVGENLIDKVIEVGRHGDKIIKLKLVLGIIYNFISAYAPQVGRPREEKERFWIQLSEVMEKIADAEKIIISGDLNGHVGDKRGGFERVLGKYTYGQRNDEGMDILEFCQTFDLRIANSIFAKPFDKLVTFKS